MFVASVPAEQEAADRRPMFAPILLVAQSITERGFTLLKHRDTLLSHSSSIIEV